MEHELDNYLLYKAAQRGERYTTFIVDGWPKLSSISENVILGSFSWFFLNTKRRLVSRDFLRMVGEQPCTPSDLARDYLEFKYPNKLKTTKTQWVETRKARHHPIYAVPCEIPDAVYVDLKAAYWTILRVIGWDVDYMPGRFMGVKALMDDFPFPADKLARNCLVTAGLVTQSRMWVGKKGSIIVAKRGNQKTNRVMWMAVQDILNGIAHQMVGAGAVYVHTDGYIFSRRDFDRCIQVLQSWGLNYAIKHQGRCTVYGAGTYEIGEHKPKGMFKANSPINGVYEPVKLDWLKSTFVRHAERVLNL